MSRCFDVTIQMELLPWFKGLKGKCHSKVRQRLIEVWGESQEDGLMLVVQGRLVWEKYEGTMGFMYFYCEKYD